MGVYHQGDGLHGPDGPHTLQVVAIGSLWGDATVGLALRHRLGTARDIAAWGPRGTYAAPARWGTSNFAYGVGRRPSFFVRSLFFDVRGQNVLDTFSSKGPQMGWIEIRSQNSQFSGI